MLAARRLLLSHGTLGLSAPTRTRQKLADAQSDGRSSSHSGVSEEIHTLAPTRVQIVAAVSRFSGTTSFRAGRLSRHRRV